ncbi:MAG: lipocalin family protein [Bacteroidia bacterium]|nr:lipocalin family protein [Bacteroidia bacterium]
MIKNNIYSAILFLCLIIFAKCTKYDQGPEISLLPPKVRLQRTWKYDKFTDLTNNITCYNCYKDWEITFEKNNTLKKKVIYLNNNIWDEKIITGTWELIEKDSLMLDEEGMPTEYYTIMRLTRKELWIQNSYERIEFKYSK